jgi:hypothetical protein
MRRHGGARPDAVRPARLPLSCFAPRPLNRRPLPPVSPGADRRIRAGGAGLVDHSPADACGWTALCRCRGRVLHRRTDRTAAREMDTTSAACSTGSRSAALRCRQVSCAPRTELLRVPEVRLWHRQPALPLSGGADAAFGDLGTAVAPQDRHRAEHCCARGHPTAAQATKALGAPPGGPPSSSPPDTRSSMQAQLHAGAVRRAPQQGARAYRGTVRTAMTAALPLCQSHYEQL